MNINGIGSNNSNITSLNAAQLTGTQSSIARGTSPSDSTQLSPLASALNPPRD
jgi:hypothetical protein